jgi:hypothetical protein
MRWRTPVLVRTEPRDGLWAIVDHLESEYPTIRLCSGCPARGEALRLLD